MHDHASLMMRLPGSLLFMAVMAVLLVGCAEDAGTGGGEGPGGCTPSEEVLCQPETGGGGGGSAGPAAVRLLDAAATLRKASLQIAGRLPTAAEMETAKQGGVQALPQLLGAMMGEPAFLTRVKEIWNDVLLTDANLFARGYDGIIVKAIAAARFPQRTWYGSPDTDAGRLTVDAIAREPLELIAHVVGRDRPFTEILTARYRMVNPYSARTFGVSPAFKNPQDLSEFAEVQIPGIHEYAPGQSEYAGVLTTTSFLYRYPNTETNRNRKRSRYFYKFFQGFDILKSAQRLDLSRVDVSQNPWRNNPACTACHAALDPVAGAFQNWTNCYSGQDIRYYRPNERHCNGSWYPQDGMFPPGTGTGDQSTLPAAALPRALEALVQAATRHPGFARAVVMHMYTGLLGRPLRAPPADAMDPDYAALLSAYEQEQTVIGRLAEGFARDGYSLKRLVSAIVLSEPFRAASTTKDDRLELAWLGGGTLTPPEVLHRKIEAVIGAPWGTAGSLRDRSTRSSPFYLLGLDKLRLPYGGIDSSDGSSRLALPGGLSAAASQRMAYEMACEYVAVDFAAERSRRRLFPHVERTTEISGDPAQPGQADILRNLRHLHERFLGERLSDDSPELRISYDLLAAAAREGQQAMAAGMTPRTLTDRCRGARHYATGDPISGGSADDPRYIVRAWQAVIAYLLMDYGFLFE
jgi:hypothetical protein